MSEASLSFGRELVARGTIGENELATALDYHAAAKVSFAEALVHLRFVEPPVLARIAGEYARAARLDLAPRNIDRTLLERLPRALLRQQGVVPIRSGGRTVLALSRPLEPIVRDEIERLAGEPLDVVRVRLEDLEPLLERLADPTPEPAPAEPSTPGGVAPDHPPEEVLAALLEILERKGVLEPGELAAALDPAFGPRDAAG